MSRVGQLVWIPFALLALITWALHLLINVPVKLVSSVGAEIVAGEFYPIDKWSAQKPPKMIVKLDSGQSLTIPQNLPFDLKHGDRLLVETWKRRFFGYQTTYRPK